MKNAYTFLIAIFIGLFTFQLSANDKSNNNTFPPEFTPIAEKLGMTKNELAFAIHQYGQLMTGEQEANFKTFDQLDAISPYMDAIENNSPNLAQLKQSFVEQLNEHKTGFANQLGLHVYQLNSFLDAMNALETTAKFQGIVSSNQKVMTSTGEGNGNKCTGCEIIEIRCYNDECGNGGGSSITLSTRIWDKAQSAGIAQSLYVWRNPFVVKFVDNNNDNLLKKEIWIYNNYSGARKYKDMSCSNCETNKPQ